MAQLADKWVKSDCAGSYLTGDAFVDRARLICTGPLARDTHFEYPHSALIGKDKSTPTDR